MTRRGVAPLCLSCPLKLERSACRVDFMRTRGTPPADDALGAIRVVRSRLRRITTGTTPNEHVKMPRPGWPFGAVRYCFRDGRIGSCVGAVNDWDGHRKCNCHTGSHNQHELNAGTSRRRPRGPRQMGLAWPARHGRSDGFAQATRRLSWGYLADVGATLDARRHGRRGGYRLPVASSWWTRWTR